jgi:hypothetical protein
VEVINMDYINEAYERMNKVMWNTAL